MAFWEERVLPSDVTGPMDFAPLLRDACCWAMDMMLISSSVSVSMMCQAISAGGGEELLEILEIFCYKTRESLADASEKAVNPSHCGADTHIRGGWFASFCKLRPHPLALQMRKHASGAG